MGLRAFTIILPSRGKGVGKVRMAPNRLMDGGRGCGSG